MTGQKNACHGSIQLQSSV